MLTTLAGLGLNKRQNRGAGPRTEALHAASEVLKQLGRKATLAVILRLEGLEPPPWCARHRVYRDTPRTWRLDMHAGFETHGTEHGQQVIKCGFGKKKKEGNSQEDNECFANAAACGLPPEPSACVLLRTTVGRVGVACQSMIALYSHSCQSHARHQNKLQGNHPTHSCPDRPLASHTVFAFQIGGVPRQPLYFSKKWFPLYPSCVLFLT